MILVGEDPKKHINEFSNQFLKAFISQLKTAHGEKSVHINHFYQEYIADKDHIHMNATKWSSLTEFAKYLGRESICRVEEGEKGLMIAWIDNSPEALRRQEALRRKEMQDKDEEELEQMMIREQIKRAQKSSGAKDESEEPEDRGLRREEGEKITLSFGAKPAATTNAPGDGSSTDAQTEVGEASKEPEKLAEKPAGLSMKMAKPQAKNIFAQAKKNALAGGSKKAIMPEQPKKMSEAERIMKEEMERKRAREESSGGQSKKMKFSFGR